MMRTRRTRLPVIGVAVGAIMALLAVIAFPQTAFADAGFDNSSWQGCYDANAARNSGASFSITKLTEGTNYVNPTAGCQVNANRAAGLRIGAYHFARPEYGNSPEAEADMFDNQAHAMGLVGNGVIPFLDWEPPASQRGNTAWAKRWLDRVSQYWNLKPAIYMSASTISAGDWSAVANSNYGLWVAGYPRGYTGERLRDPGAPPYNLGPWQFAMAWQYSSSGSVSGVGTNVDVNWFYGDAGTWAKYANAPVGSVPNPAPAPAETPKDGAPTGDANALADEVIRGVYGNDPARHAALGSRYDEVMAIVNQRLGGGSSASGGSYVVKSGDSLSAVFGSSWPSVAQANGIRPPYTIYPGQRLVTSGGGSSASGGSYRVQPGDTLSGIASRYGTSWQRLAQINGLANANFIVAGQTLRIG